MMTKPAQSTITRPAHMSGWWLASIGLHAAALTGLYVKPDVVDLSDSSAKSASSDKRVREVIAEAQAAQARTLADKLDDMRAAGERLKSAAEAKLNQYDEQAKKDASPVDPTTARQAIEQAQAEAADVQKQVTANPEPASLEKIEKAQARAIAAQDQLLKAFEQSPAKHRDELLRQDRARQAQIEAQAAQSAAIKLQRDASGESAEGKKILEETRKLQEDVDEAAETVTKAETNLARLQSELDKAAAATQPATALDEKAAKKAQQNYQKARDRLPKGNADVAKAQTNLANRRQKASASPSTNAGGAGAMSAKAKQAQSDANAAQLRANQVQAQANQPKIDSPDAIDRPRTMSEVYDRARAQESEMIDRYREMRAADLAMMQEISLSEALRLIDVPRPKRPEFDRELLEGQRGDPNELAAAMKAVSSEIDSMASAAQRLAAESQSRAASGNLNGAWVRDNAERIRQNDQLAMQDAGVIAKDLTAAMGSGAGGAGASAGGAGASAGGAGASAHGAGASAHGAGASAHGAGASAQGAGASAQGAGASAQGVGASAGARLSGELGQSLRQEATRDLRPIPGRRVGTGSVSIESSRRAQWMFIDTWHLIGPWPNASRSEINTRFPPESIVDLDATYITKANQRVAWRFYQAAKEMVSPPGMREYEIYYGYSELWFDTPQNLWVAIGSDDQSQVWIEDHLIWKSSNAHKDWNAIEGFRKVHFKQGRNRVLVRLENGHGNGGFSFVVNLDPSFGPSASQ